LLVVAEIRVNGKTLEVRVSPILPTKGGLAGPVIYVGLAELSGRTNRAEVH